MDLRGVTKQICKLWPNGKKLVSTCVQNLSFTKVSTSTQVVASQCKLKQVGDQTKVSPKLALTCESVWPGFKFKPVKNK